MEDLLFGSNRPVLIKAGSETTCDIFWPVSTASGLNLGDKALHVGKIFSETLDGESLGSIAMISVTNEGNSNDKCAFTRLLDVVDDFLQCFFGPVDPGAHRSCAIQKKTEVKELLTIDILAGGSLALGFGINWLSLRLFLDGFGLGR